MLLKDKKVTRPKTTKIQRRNGIGYVYQVVNKTYNKEKKYYTDTRVCIGKMMDDTYMIPNERFIDYYSVELADMLDPGVFSDTLHVGTYCMIQKIMQDLQLEELIEGEFGDYTARIKDILAYMLITENSVFQHYPDVMRMYPTFSKKVIDDSTLCRWMQSITDQDIHTFLKAWNRMQSNDSVYVSCDSTNMNTAAQGIELAEYGHPKKDEGLPQVNIAYAIDHKDSTPLFYDQYEGNINDVSEVCTMFRLAKEYGYKNIGLILDRGYFSTTNIKDMDTKGYRFIMMMKSNNQCVQKAIDQVRISLRNMVGYYIDEHSICGTTVKGKLFKSDGKKRYFHVYYDDIRASEERKGVLAKYNQYEKELDKAVEAKIKTEGQLKKYRKAFYLYFDNNGYFKGYKRNDKYIKKQLDNLGYFTIVSSEELSASYVLDTYRNRDNIEKLIRGLKTGLGYDKFRVYSDEALRGKTFLIFLALIIRNQIFLETKKYRNRNKKDGTIPALLKELDKIECTKGNNGKYTRRYKLTPKQKKILKCFELNEKDVDRIIANFNEE